MSSEELLDHPFYEVTAQAEAQAAKGHLTYQKFTCVGCGNRLTMDTPNKFYKQGTCDQCTATTDIEAQGCNFLLIMVANPGEST